MHQLTLQLIMRTGAGHDLGPSRCVALETEASSPIAGCMSKSLENAAQQACYVYCREPDEAMGTSCLAHTRDLPVLTAWIESCSHT